MKIFYRYVFRNLTLATVFIALVLAGLIFLTQSLKFLELVIESGASARAFLWLTLLAMPRFLEIILPLSLMTGILFFYNRLAVDSELVAIRAAGYSPLRLARPALSLACCMTLFLWVVAFWVAPQSSAGLQALRHVIRAQMSALMFREGVFNHAGDGLIVYVKEHGASGELRGLMIHDAREKSREPATILARRGMVYSDKDGYHVEVYEGSRQVFDPLRKDVQRLNFERYTVDMPEAGDAGPARWKQPEERTLGELLRPDMRAPRDVENLEAFHVEIHRRITAPLLTPVFALMSCAALFLGSTGRRGQAGRMALAVACAVGLDAAFIAAFNLSKQSVIGIPLMYFIILVPMAAAFIFLSEGGEGLRRTVLPPREGARP